MKFFVTTMVGPRLQGAGCQVDNRPSFVRQFSVGAEGSWWITRKWGFAVRGDLGYHGPVF